MQAMRTGVNQTHIDELKNNKDFYVDIGRQYGNAFINFKMDAPPFSDPRVRNAVFRALNIDQVNQVGLQGSGYITGGLSMPGLDWELPEADLKQRFKFDGNEAKQLLTAAGAANINVEVGSLNLAPHTTLNQLYQQHLRAVGINITLTQLDNVAYAGNALNPANKYAMNMGSSSPSPLPTADIQPRFYTGGSRNSSKLADPKLDGLIDKQAQALNVQERRAALTELQKYFLDNYFQWAYGVQNQVLYSSALQGVAATVPSENDCWTRAWIKKA
jgi:peptide/nickel transport system substrate-binding protein